jgi:hypothetical protein
MGPPGSYSNAVQRPAQNFSPEQLRQGHAGLRNPAERKLAPPAVSYLNDFKNTLAQNRQVLEPNEETSEK